MNSLVIKVQTLENAGKDRRNNIMPETIGNTIEAPKLTVCFLEDMTAAHKCGVSFVMDLGDGRYITHMITEGLMENLVSAFNGTKGRFSDLQKERGFDPYK